MKLWILYVCILGFAVYWTSNLLLWFPWSYSATLGIVLMLTVSPIIWFFTTYLALKTYPGTNLIKGAFIVALFFLLLAAVMDYIFFGIIRNAMEQLYHPSTLYGYGFLIGLPFIIILIFKNRILRLRKMVTNLELIKAVIWGVACLSILALIITFEIEF